MKVIKQAFLTGVVIWLATLGAMAQTNISSAVGPSHDGLAVAPEKLTVTDASTASNLRPPRAERQKLPPEVVERIERFKRDARAYLDKQEALKKQLQGANDKERAAIRDRMKHLREEWLERARELRKEFRQRQLELIDKLPDYREVIESARAAAVDQAHQTQPSTRPHRGED